MVLPFAMLAGASGCMESSTDWAGLSDDKAEIGPKMHLRRVLSLIVLLPDHLCIRADGAFWWHLIAL